MALWKWLGGKTASEEGTTEAKGAERRAAQRYYNTKVSACELVKLPASITIPAELRDISRTGLGLACRKHVEPGAFLVVNLTGPNRYTCTLQARVVHSTQQTKELCIVGCVLTQELTPEQLKAIL